MFAKPPKRVDSENASCSFEIGSGQWEEDHILPIRSRKHFFVSDIFLKSESLQIARSSKWSSSCMYGPNYILCDTCFFDVSGKKNITELYNFKGCMSKIGFCLVCPINLDIENKKYFISGLRPFFENPWYIIVDLHLLNETCQWKRDLSHEWLKYWIINSKLPMNIMFSIKINI